MVGPRRRGGGRTDARLDPIRWRPGRGAMLRLTAVAALLLMAVLVTWSAPESCVRAPHQAVTTATSPGRTGAGPDGGTGQGGDRVTAERHTAGSGRAGSGPAGQTAGSAGQTAGSAGQTAGSAGQTAGSAGQTAGSDGHPTVPQGRVGVPIRLAEPTALALVRPGDRVDLLRVGDKEHHSSTVAAAALVLGVTGADDPITGGLLLALTPVEAERAVTEPGSGFAVLIRP